MMFAFTLKHPWPYAFLRLGKDVENRGWKPASRHSRTRLALHGGVYPRGRAWDEAQRDLEWMQSRGLAPADLNLADAIVEGLCATAYYRGAWHSGNALNPLRSSPWFSGPWGWALDELVAFEQPIPCQGALGLWLVTGASVTQALRKQLGEIGV